MDRVPPTATTSTNLMAGSSAFLALLKSEGITHLFGNPGTIASG